MNFLKKMLGNFVGEIFWKNFFGRIFLGGGILCLHFQLSYLIVEGIDFFVKISILSRFCLNGEEGRKNLDP